MDNNSKIVIKEISITKGKNHGNVSTQPASWGWSVSSMVWQTRVTEYSIGIANSNLYRTNFYNLAEYLKMHQHKVITDLRKMGARESCGDYTFEDRKMAEKALEYFQSIELMDVLKKVGERNAKK